MNLDGERPLQQNCASRQEFITTMMKKNNV
jgi:hypothetical protein